jgi:hypothetical protein
MAGLALVLDTSILSRSALARLAKIERVAEEIVGRGDDDGGGRG